MIKTSTLLNILILIGVATYFIHISVFSFIVLDNIRTLENITEDIQLKGIPIFITLFPVIIPIPLKGMELAILLITLYTLFSIYDYVRKVDGTRPITQVFTWGSVVLLLSLVIELVQSSAGIETGMLETENEYIFFLGAMDAPLSEEIGFRMFIIGIVSLIFYLSRDVIDYRGMLLSVIHPYRIHKDENILRALYILVVIQAFLFGLAHLLGGGGWEIGKVTTASIAGIYLGYLFVKYGITTAILGHAFFNIYLLTISYLGNIAIQTGSNLMIIYSEILFFYILIFGGLYIIVYLYRLVKSEEAVTYGEI